MNDWERAEQANRDLAEQRYNMGKDPGGSYADLNQKYENNQYGSSNNGCFPKGTQIDTLKGKQDIAHLRAGDLVLSLDTKTSTLACKKILQVNTHVNNRIWHIHFNDGSNVNTTAAHSFIVNGKWHKASSINSGDVLTYIDKSGACCTKLVTCSQPSNKVETVYNLIIEGNFTFIADDVVAHSFTHFKAVRMFYYRLVCRLSNKTKQPAKPLFASA